LKKLQVRRRSAEIIIDSSEIIVPSILASDVSKAMLINAGEELKNPGSESKNEIFENSAIKQILKSNL
jgi:hypothetical protein